ncbi:hypothetical protein [Spirosoma harenae]
MKLILATLCLGIFSQAFMVAPVAPKPTAWKSLFNGKNLVDWETCLDRPDKRDQQGTPLGFNNRPMLAHTRHIVNEQENH